MSNEGFAKPYLLMIFMRFLLIVFAFIFTFPFTFTTATAQSPAKITVSVEYHRPTDLFALMDGVSNWYFNDNAYQKAWVERFGLSTADKKLIKLYRKYRDKTYNDPSQKDNDFRTRQNGIFAAKSSYSLTTDPLAEHFVNSNSIEEALSNLEKVASSADAQQLRIFYNNFESKWTLILNESKKFSSAAQALSAELAGNKIDAYLNRVSAFYGIDVDLNFKVRFVWWPPINRTLADISGNTAFLRINPAKHSANGGWDEIAMHELLHYISAHQPIEQKHALTEEFLKLCPIKKNNIFVSLFKSQNVSQYLEEPMAVAWGQAAFAEYVKEQPLDPSQDWYRNSTIEIMSRLIWLDVQRIYDSEALLNKQFIQRAAKSCSRLTNVN